MHRAAVSTGPQQNIPLEKEDFQTVKTSPAQAPSEAACAQQRGPTARTEVSGIMPPATRVRRKELNCLDPRRRPAPWDMMARASNCDVHGPAQATSRCHNAASVVTASSSQGESGRCSDKTSTLGAWRHAGVRFLLSGASLQRLFPVRGAGRVVSLSVLTRGRRWACSTRAGLSAAAARGKATTAAHLACRLGAQCAQQRSSLTSL